MQWTIDRIEGEYAVLEHPETLETHERLLTDLPKGVKESDILTEDNGVWSVDKEAREKRMAQISERFNKLVSKSKRSETVP